MHKLCFLNMDIHVQAGSYTTQPFIYLLEDGRQQISVLHEDMHYTAFATSTVTLVEHKLFFPTIVIH